MPREKNPEAVSSRKRAPRKAAVDAGAAVTPAPTFVDPEQRAGLIARAAYFRAQRRASCQATRSRTGWPRRPRWTPSY